MPSANVSNNVSRAYAQHARMDLTISTRDVIRTYSALVIPTTGIRCELTSTCRPAVINAVFVTACGADGPSNVLV